MIWRLRLFFEKLGRKEKPKPGWKLLLAVGVGVVALVAAGAAFVIVRGGDEKAAATTNSEEQFVNLFYLRALPPKLTVQGCTMYIRFTWKPDYHANQYIGAPALITAAGAGIDGMHNETFKASGVSLDVGPLPLGGGYKLWSAEVTSLDGDPPGNNTKIQAAPPASTKCG